MPTEEELFQEWHKRAGYLAWLLRPGGPGSSATTCCSGNFKWGPENEYGPFRGKTCREVYASEVARPAGKVAEVPTMRRPTPEPERPPLVGHGDALMTEERIAALTYEADKSADPLAYPLPPGPGLIKDSLARVCPSCHSEVPGWEARCRYCAFGAKPVFRLRSGGAL